MIAWPPKPTSRTTPVGKSSPAGIAESITGRDYLSYSQVSTYQACSLRWYFSYVRGYEPESVSAALLLGSGVHAAIQQHYRAVLALEPPPGPTELMETFAQSWHENARSTPVEYGKAEDPKSSCETAQRILEAFVDSPYAWPAGQILGVEETLAITLTDDLPPLLAKVDLIEHQDETLTITDFKTARSMWNPETAEEKAEQLILYGFAAEEIAKEMGADIRLRFVVATKAKTAKIDEFVIPTDDDRVLRSVATFRQVFEGMKHQIVYPSPSKMNCSGCGYQRRCRTWHREVGQQ